MAKRKKKDEEEEFEFDFPEFDRVDYMKNEIRKGKSVLVSVAVAPIFSYLAMVVFEFSGYEWIFGLMVGILGIGLLGTIFNVIGIDTSEFDKKEWALNGAMYFFTFLAFWVILMNPPLNDIANPRVNNLEVQVYDQGQWKPIDEVNITEDTTYNVTLIVKITDNTGVKSDSVKLIFDNNEYSMDSLGDHRYSKTLPEGLKSRSNSYSVQIKMEDNYGNKDTASKVFYIKPDTE